MADAALASRMLVLRRRSTGGPLTLDPALEIGAGGEAVVYGLPGDASLVAKLYRQPTLERARKLARMIEAPPALAGDAALAWPVELLTDPNGGRFAGFLMPRAEGPRIFEFYNPISRRRAAPLFDWGLLHRAGVSLSAAFDALHGAGYVVGDVNESNILLSPDDASVTLVDADSFQVRDRVGTVHRSGVGKAEFTPPELQGARFADVDRAPEHDRFGLAVLLFLLLMEGTHPFAQRLEGDAESLPVEERIRRGLYPYARPDDGCKPPRLAPPLETLHPGVQALFARCFVDGHADPAARPSAAEWRDALALAEAELRACDANPQHRFGAHVPFCPWCHRRRLLQGRDPFPASVELARATDLAPLAGRGAALPRQWARPSAATVAPPAPAPLPPPQPAPPGPVAIFLDRVQAALPPWIAGPTALGSPVPWAAPAALTILFGVTGGMRVLAMMVGFFALRRLFRAGPGAFTRVTALWVVGLLLLWYVVAGLAGVVGGLSATGTSDSYVTVVEPSDAYRLAEVERLPTLANPAEVDEALAVATASASSPHSLLQGASSPHSLLQGASSPHSLLQGSVLLHFVVNRDGSVDPRTVTLIGSPNPEAGSIALDLAAVLRFEPALKDGVPVPVWMDYTITLPAPAP